MNKTKILATLAIPALFAACAQEEFTETTPNKVDLSSRKVIENVVLNFGGETDTRAGIGTTSWNSYAWTSEDGVGACIIDDNAGNITPFISTNYKYYFTSENQWKTDALMVEGQYMFYAPYDGTHLTRNNIKATLPTVQNVKTQTDDNNAIAEFYASGKPVFVGYKKLSAKGQEPVISVNMRHIFAYPLFKLVNNYDTRTATEIANGVAPKYQDITVAKVVLSLPGNAKIPYAFNANNTDVQTWLATSAWDEVKHETAATGDLFDVATVNSNRCEVKSITINFGEGITLKGEEALSFHAVFPAAAYTNGIEAVAYDVDGNSYSVSNDRPRTGLTLNPGYRYPAQEYNTDGSLKASKGTLLTYELTDKNAAPTDIADNEDFLAYLKSLTVRYNSLTQIASSQTAANESQFKLNDDAAIVINSDLIDALYNYNYVVGGTGGSVTFNSAAAGATFEIAKDVTVTNATFDTDHVNLEVASAAGKEYAITLPATTTMSNTAGTYVINSGTLTIASNQAAPTNIIITGSVSYDGTNANKITSLNNCNGNLTLTGTVENVQINNNGTLDINAGALVTGKVVNNETGTINNSGTMYAETNVNNGYIVATSNSVTKVASGYGTINNNALGAVKANSDQYVTWKGLVSAITGTNGLAAKGEAKYGINYVTITDATLTNITLAQLKAPIKGCTVSIVELSNATSLTLPAGGDMSGLTLVFDSSCDWIGDSFNAPVFTNASIAVANGKTVSVSFATVSGTQVKYQGYTTGKISAKDSTGKVNF